MPPDLPLLYLQLRSTKHFAHRGTRYPDDRDNRLQLPPNGRNGTTKAKQKRSIENAEPPVGCTNKPGNVRGEWSAIVTTVLGLHAHEGKPTTPKVIFNLFSLFPP